MIMAVSLSLLCILLQAWIYSAVGSIIAVPVETSVYQCGCNNSNLHVLTPTTPDTVTELVLTGFFYFATSQYCDVNSLTTGHLLPAAFVALDEINNSSEILPGYHLSLDLRDSMCDVVHATTEFIDTLEDRVKDEDLPLNLGIVGPGCDAVTESLAGVISRSLRLPVVSYAPNTQTKSIREKDAFSSLFQLSRSLLLTVQTAIRLMQDFGWTSNTSFVYEEGNDFFLSVVENVIDTETTGDVQLDGGNGTIPVEVFSLFEVEDNGLAVSTQMQDFFTDLESGSLRVVLGLLSQKVAAQLVCTGADGTIPGDGFLYIFVGQFEDNWWKVEKDSCNLTDADVQSVIIVSERMIDTESDTVLQSGRTIHDFKVDYFQRLETWCGGTLYDTGPSPSPGSVYDTVWALALALNQTTDLIDAAVDQGLQYDPATLDGVVQALRELDFSGVTGRVQFDGSQRIGAESILQVQNGQLVEVGIFTDKLIFNKFENFIWNDSTNITPSATFGVDPVGVDVYWLVLGLVFSVAGIIFAIVMWVFNWYHANHKILRATSQKLNYVILVGVILSYLTVIILTILESPLGAEIDVTTFKVLCLIRIWMLPLAFTFVYGILFARAWRIYRIFNNPWHSSRPYKDGHLLLGVLGIAAIDLLILIPWTIIDPYRLFPRQSDVDYGTFSACVFTSCSSDDVFIWLAVLSVFKIAVIVSGVLIISLVRREVIHRKIYDDSKSLALANYITALAFVLGLPLTFLFLNASQVVLAYIVSAIWVNISSWGTLIIIFMPKVYRILTKDSGNSYKKAGRLYYGKEFSVTTKPGCTIATEASTSVDPEMNKRTLSDAIVDNGVEETCDSKTAIEDVEGTDV